MQNAKKKLYAKGEIEQKHKKRSAAQVRISSDLSSLHPPRKKETE